MKSLVIRILIVSAMALVFSFTALGQTRCERDYRTCVGDCNATRDRTLATNRIRRAEIRRRLNQDLLQCNIQFINNAARRTACRNEAIERANRALAAIDALDRQARRDRITCITECRRRLRECEQPPRLEPTLSGGFTIDCLEGGAPCRGAVSEFCTMAVGACDDCWRSMCGGGEWRIESEVDLRSVTLVAVSDRFRNGRVLATSAINGKRATLTVPRDLKLQPGEQLYFQFRSRTKPQGPVKVAIQRDKP